MAEVLVHVDEALAAVRRAAYILDRVGGSRETALLDAAVAHLNEAAVLMHEVSPGEVPGEPLTESAPGPVPCAVHTRVEGEAVVVDVAGDCGLAAVPTLIRVARQSAAAATVVVIDFTEATTLDHVAVAALHRLQREATERGGRLAVCGGPAVQDELRRGRLEPFPDVASALGRHGSSPRLVATWPLAPDQSGLVAARQKIRQTCLEWRVPVRVANNVVDVASELLSNAFGHGRPPVVLTMQVGVRAVRVEVSDGSFAPARPRPYRSGVSESGLGLRLVEHLSATWGQITHDEGKTVWALLSLSEPARQARV